MDTNWLLYLSYALGWGFALGIVGIFSYIVVQSYRTR